MVSRSKGQTSLVFDFESVETFYIYMNLLIKTETSLKPGEMMKMLYCWENSERQLQKKMLII